MDGRHHELSLTPRQRDVLRMIERGHTNAEIADRLGISLQGAKWHVSELMAKFGVDTREELAERWRSGRNRLARLAGALSLPSFLSWKLAAATVAGVAAAGAGTAVLLVATSGASGPELEPVLPVAAQAPAGAEFTRSEAIAKAENLLNSRLYGGSIERNAVTVPRVQDFTLDSAEFLLGIGRWNHPDGDRYWESGAATFGSGGVGTFAGGAQDVWVFAWSLPSLALDGSKGHQSAPVEVRILMEDGSGTGLAYDVRILDPSGHDFQGESSLRSTSANETMRLMVEPATDEVRVAWLDNVPGSREMRMYQSIGGNWCVVAGGGAGCGMRPELVLTPMQVGLGSSGGGGTESFWYLTAITSTEVTSIEVIGKNGASAVFETQAAPKGAPQCLRYAFIQVNDIGNDLEIIGRDAGGNEVAREHRAFGITPDRPAWKGPNPGCV